MPRSARSPDVLVVDDLVSSHMVPLLLTAAAEGLLVFVSMTAPSAAVAVERFVELAPPEMRKAVQNAMAESFRGAVAQVLLKKAGGGLVAAREVLLATAPVTRVIGEGQLAQLPLTLEGGRKHGMVSFNDSIVDSSAPARSTCAKPSARRPSARASSTISSATGSTPALSSDSRNRRFPSPGSRFPVPDTISGWLMWRWSARG